MGEKHQMASMNAIHFRKKDTLIIPVETNNPWCYSTCSHFPCGSYLTEEKYLKTFKAELATSACS